MTFTSILNILRLKILDLAAAKALMIMLLVLPPLLGLIAGTANLANQEPVVRLAVVDLDQSPASRELIDALETQGWSIAIIEQADAARMLLRQEVDGIIRIDPGYEAELPEMEIVHLHYAVAEGSLLTSMVREAIASVVLPKHTRMILLDEVLTRYEELGLAPPVNLADLFDASAAYYTDNQARLDVIYEGAPVYEPALSYLVSDYSMEVFFLSIYAILGTLILSGSAIRRRLAATRNGLLLDYSLSIVALFLLGLLQISLYSVAMLGLMQTPVRPRELAILAVCLFVMLGLGQILTLFHDRLRLYFSLLILLLLSVASGCFFQLSEQLIRQIGQYLPQGWALAALRGYPVLPAAVPLLIALVLLSAGYAIQVVRTRQMR